MSEYSSAQVENEHWQRQLRSLQDEMKGASADRIADLQRKVDHANFRIEATENTMANIRFNQKPCPKCGGYH